MVPSGNQSKSVEIAVTGVGILKAGEAVIESKDKAAGLL